MSFAGEAMKPLFSSYHLEGILAVAAGADPSWGDPACRGGIYLGTVPEPVENSAFEAVFLNASNGIDPADIPEIPKFSHIKAYCFESERGECHDTVHKEQAVCLATMCFEPRGGSCFSLTDYEPGSPGHARMTERMADPIEAFGYCCERALLEEIQTLLDNLAPISMALARRNLQRIQAACSFFFDKSIRLVDPDPAMLVGPVHFDWTGNSYPSFAPSFKAQAEKKLLSRAAEPAAPNPRRSI